MTLNQRVLSAVNRHVKVGKWAAVIILSLDEQVLLTYCKTAWHELGVLLREYEEK